MAAIRVLIVDDSVVIRKILTETLSADREIEIAGSASDGRIALSKLAQIKPDVVTLDIEMPVMNGLETLKELRKSHPALPVIMFSTLTERGASATLDALSFGASDYVTKPSNTGSMDAGIAAIRTELIPKIKALCRRTTVKPRLFSSPKPVGPLTLRAKQPIDIVAIGTSTGGPNALAEVLPRLPKDLPVPIVVVQHMPPIFTRFLAERLSAQSQITVSEASDGADLAPGQAWIAPGNFHMTVSRRALRGRVDLNQDPPEHSCRPAVDVLFRSVASTYRSNVLGVVMTGMGSDGVLGAKEIREAGGEVLIQDEATAVVWGMPGLVYAAGQADGVYPLDQLATQITRRVMQSRIPRTAVSTVMLESHAK